MALVIVTWLWPASHIPVESYLNEKSESKQSQPVKQPVGLPLTSWVIKGHTGVFAMSQQGDRVCKSLLPTTPKVAEVSTARGTISETQAPWW